MNKLEGTCANCGKGEEDVDHLKSCAACKMVKYCSRDCQIAHRPQHKKLCKKRAAELHDEKIFKQPPPKVDDCPICFLRMPSLTTGRRYMNCCGKNICSGCIHAVALGGKEKDICPFCRSPPSNSERKMKRYKERSDLNDGQAICNLGAYYAEGSNGLPQNYAKALELYHRAGELGNADAYYNIGSAYTTGDGVDRDEKKAKHYWELAAMRGNVEARHNLGSIEANLGNMDRALRHWMIAVRDGDPDTLEKVKTIYMEGNATKDDYTTALRYYQAYLEEIKSDQRDEAAALYDDSKYY